MRGRANLERASRLRLAVCLLVLAALSAGIAFAGNFIVTGQVTGPCMANANVSIRAYEAGYLSNPGYLEISTSALTNGAGIYSKSVLEPGTDHNLDFIAVASKPECDPGLSGNSTVLNAVDPSAIGFTDVDMPAIAMSYSLALSSPGNGDTVFDNTTYFAWLSNGGANATYTLEVDNESGFSSPVVSQAGIILKNYTLNSSQQLPDGTYYWRVSAYSSGILAESTAAWSFLLAGTGTAIMSITPAENAWTTNPVSATATTNVDSECRYSLSSSAYSTKTLMAGTSTAHSASITLPSQGPNTIYIQCNSSLLGLSSEYQRTVNLDSIRPSNSTASVTVEHGRNYSISTTLDFNWTGFTDPSPGSNISGYYYSFTNNGGTASGTYDTAPPGQLTNAPQGNASVYVWAVDNVGNIGYAAYDSIIVDTLPPALGTPSTTPADLNKYSTGSFTVCLAVTDSSPLQQGYPRINYRIGSSAYSAAYTMNLSGSLYCYPIPEPSGGWFNNNGISVDWNITARDIHGMQNAANWSEWVEDSISPPVLAFIPNMNITQGNTTYFNITATDPDKNTLNYYSNKSGLGITKINNTLAQVSWTPNNNDVGLKAVRFWVSDGTLNDSQVVLINVINANDPPVLQEIDDIYIHEYHPMNFSANATDPDGDTLDYRTNSSIFAINSRTGEISYIPNYQDRGSYAINLSVTDGNGGYDDTSFTITVGYCGDNICRTTYENCESCEIDCGICGESETAAILISPRNCVNTSMKIHAVKLVKRATCDVEGLIVDGMEVCGNLTNTELTVMRKANGTYEQEASVVTDSYGLAFWTPIKTGEYRLGFKSTYTSRYSFFTAKVCTEEEIAQQNVEQKDDTPDDDRSFGPELEEPRDEHTGEAENRIRVLYLLIAIILLAAILVTVVRYTYIIEKRKQQSGYVELVDKSIALAKKKWQEFAALVRQSKYTGKAYAYSEKWTKISVEFLSRFLKKLRNKKLELVSRFKLTRILAIPYYRLEGIVQYKKNELILLSVMKYFHKKESLESLMNRIEHKIDIIKGIGYSSDLSIMEIGTVLVNLGVNARYEKSKHSIMDIKMRLADKVVCLADLIYSSQYSPTGFVKSMVIITGYDKENIYVHNYTEDKKNQQIPAQAFAKAWKNSGSTLLIVYR